MDTGEVGFYRQSDVKFVMVERDREIVKKVMKPKFLSLVDKTFHACANVKEIPTPEIYKPKTEMNASQKIALNFVRKCNQIRLFQRNCYSQRLICQQHH